MMKLFKKFKLNAEMILTHPWFYMAIILSMVLIGGYKKHDNLWDFQSYHYNNAYAFLNDTYMQYFIPSGANTFFNPLMDLPLYFLIQIFNYDPTLIYAFQAVWGGLLLCAMVKIALLFYDRYTFKTLAYILLMLAIAACGRVIFRQTGSSTNEVSIAAMDLWCLYFIFKMLKYPNEQKWYQWLILGIGMGCVLGLKQNSIAICIGTGCALIACFKHIHNPLKSIALFAVGGFIGYLITNGYFMYRFWVLYENPFFPFLNGIFKSEYFDPVNYNDKNCLSKFSWNLFHRYVFKFTNKIGGCENVIDEDYRLDIYSALSLLIMVIVLFSRRAKELYQKYPLHAFLLFLFCFTYAVWFFMFSVLRYTAILEALGVIMLVEIFRRLSDKNRFYYLVLAVITISMFGPWQIYLYRGPYRHINKYIHLEPVHLPDNTLVKFYGSLTSFMIPELARYNKNFKSVTHYGRGYNGQHSDCAERGKFRQMRDHIEANHHGPIVVIFNQKQYVEDMGRTNIEIRDKFFARNPDTGLRAQDVICRPLRHNGSEYFYICGYPEIVR